MKKKISYCLPHYCGSNFYAYDKKLLDDWGIEYLSEIPTPEEILIKAARMTGKNPVTGIMNYGIFFRGSYTTFLLNNIMEAFGGGWGSFNKETGDVEYRWNTQENIEALTWLLKASQYAPRSFLTGREEVGSWGTPDNTIAMRIDLFTITLGVSIFQQEEVTAIGNIVSVSLMAIFPIIILYLFMQRYIIAGITMGATKHQ
jgi:ABC-type glycerol-3-phosphate transport system substrate-binding protein